MSTNVAQYNIDAREEDFESLPSNYPFASHMAAGALAGMAEHGLMYPLDTIKTRLQILTPSDTLRPNVSIRNVISAEGIAGLWKGLGSLLLGAGPAHALYFATYEEAKRNLVNDSQSQVQYILATAASGSIATLVADAFMNPFDGYKSLDVCPPETACATGMKCPPSIRILRYNSVFHCFSHTIKTEGLKSLYISYPTTISLSIPFQSIQFAAYEQFKPLISSILQNFYEDTRYSPVTHVISGGLSGATAAFITNPLDVSKTLLQTRGVSSCPKIRSAGSLVDAVKIIYGREGLRGFFRGVGARVLGSVPSTGLSWLVYEYFKWVWKNDDNYGK